MKRELDKDGNYIPVYLDDGKELPSQLAYPMNPIVATELENGDVQVERDDVDEPMIYTQDTDGYQYWLAQAKAQASAAKPDEV